MGTCQESWFISLLQRKHVEKNVHVVYVLLCTHTYMTCTDTKSLHPQKFKASRLWRQSSRWICVSTTLSAKSSRTWPGTLQSSHSQWWGSDIIHGLEVEVLTRWSLWTTFATEANIIHPGLQAATDGSQVFTTVRMMVQVCIRTLTCMCVCMLIYDNLYRTNWTNKYFIWYQMIYVLNCIKISRKQCLQIIYQWHELRLVFFFVVHSLLQTICPRAIWPEASFLWFLQSQKIPWYPVHLSIPWVADI